MNKDLSNPVESIYASLSVNAQEAGDEMLFVCIIHLHEYISKY